MKYLADTLVHYIYKESMNKKGTLKFILPSYPSYILLKIGKDLEEQFSRALNTRISFLYGVAYGLGKEWGEGGNKDNFDAICEKGWYNEGNNLTSLRNTQKKLNDDCLVILLAGYDHIEDRASLQDFFHLDQQAIWNICLRKSFYNWVHDSLQSIVNPDGNKPDFNRIADLLKALFDYGLTDLIGISKYLEQQDFPNIMSGQDAYQLIVSGLSAFHLPCMNGLASRNIKKGIFNYITAAQEFFNYSMFLEATARKKINNKIVKFREQHGDEEQDAVILGKFSSLDKLIDSLQKYIEYRSVEDRELLRQADFIFINDRILGYKPKSEKLIDSKKPRKLYGLPPEVFLRALWIVLGELKKSTKTRSMLITENMGSITLRSILFKHDLETADEDDNGGESGDLAHDFLRQVLGGIDLFLEDQLRLDLDKHNNPQTIDLKSHLCPDKSDVLEYTKTSTAEPTLKFEITVSSTDGDRIRREFLWALPQNHQCRLQRDLYRCAIKEYRKGTDAFPVFTIPHTSEIFMAKDKEEVNRLLNTALKKGFAMVNLLDAQGIDSSDELKWLLLNLSKSYQEFLVEYEERGFFTALDKKYEPLRKSFSSAYVKFLEHSGVSTYGPLLIKGFMLVPSENNLDWVWNEYLPAAIVTPLHPALLEMLRHQNAFLCESFKTYAEAALMDTGDRMFSEKRWDKVVDLAKVQWPITGTLADMNKVLNTNVRSYDYIHLAGEAKNNSSFVPSRLLLEYDNVEEEDISDTELFQETRSSQLIKQVLFDYRDLHAYADDGVSIGAYCGREIQPVIAGIDAYLKQILVDREEQLYSLNLTIFTDSGDDSAIMHWVNAWKDRWQEAELSAGKQHYSNCKISIAYRVVSRTNNAEQFKNLLRGTNMDVLFFNDFIDAGVSRLEILGDEYNAKDDYRKFPVLEKVCCRKIGGGRDNSRERILSNHRFKLGSLHAEVMAHMSKGSNDPQKRHVVISSSDYKPWIEVVDVAHEQSAWVICIDPSIDEHLLQRIKDDGTSAREIIGFGTGVGPHGENNYTVSTEYFSMVDIKKKISSQISSLFNPLEHYIADLIADCLVKEAAHIAGLSVIKATGPDRFVREFIANAMVRKLLPRDNDTFCDEIISLDAYYHWFDDAADKMRPDLLRLQVKIVDGCFNIQAQIIECKLAQEAEGYLEKARQQIESGLKKLARYFRPREESKALGIDDMPDQRYWWMQLHRLIASKGETSNHKYKETLSALERLSEGYYNITWQAAAVVFWTDLDNDDLACNPEWNFDFDDQEIVISVAQAGKNFIKAVCLENVVKDIFCAKSELYFGSAKIKAEDKKPLGEKVVTEKKPVIDNSSEEETVNDKGEAKDNDGTMTTLVAREIPQRIMLGSGTTGGRDIYWEFGHPDLPNRHILVFGASGTGKTYTIQALMCELGKSGQNTLIIDYTNGFTNKQLEPIVNEKLNPKHHIIRMKPLAINPFRKQCDFIDDMVLEEDPANTAGRVRGVFSEVYQLGDQQKSALYNAIRTGVTQEGNTFNLASLISQLEEQKEAGGPTAASAASVISKIQPFVDMNPFGEEDIESWEKLFNDPTSRCHIIQLAGFMKDIGRLITEFALIDLYWYYRARGDKNNPKVIVLDEIQNLSHQLDSPLGQFLTEGRKFGISLILATQTLSNLNKDQRDRLFQASHKLFFKPADTEIRSFAQILSDATGQRIEDWIDRLSSLKRGECFSLGHALNATNNKLEVNKWSKIKIRALEERY